MTEPDDREPDDVLDVVVVGAGVMGLFTAYNASKGSARVALLERGSIGDPATASFGRTRSYRKDYLDATYVRFADEAVRLWGELETETGAEVLVRCGCMNIATASVTPDLEATYAGMSGALVRRLGFTTETFEAPQVKERFPYLRADLADLDPEAGLVNLQAVTGTLLDALGRRGVAVHEGVDITAIAIDDGFVRVVTTAGDLVARTLVVTAGHGTNAVLAQVPGCTLQVPITKDRPSEAKYLVPPADERHHFTSDVMPVIAYLDTGIYLHPIVDGVVDAVKIGYYNPPDMPRGTTSVDSIASFVEQCMPGLASATSEDVTDVDQCDYDLVADDDFVLGAVPGVPQVFVGVGWRGTGYKFAPLVGRVLAELAVRGGTVYDVSRFDPARFDPVRFDPVRFPAPASPAPASPAPPVPQASR